MAEGIEEKPIEKITNAASQAAQAESAPPRVRRYRAVVFRSSLILVVIAFGVLTFLIKTTPFFAVDLQITRGVQMINFPVFMVLMSLISWPGFVPQSMVITGLIVVLIYGIGLRWEAVMALIASVFSTGINLLVKDLVQRPRPTPDMTTVYVPLPGFSFPSGHVMFYFGFFGFIWFLTFTLLKPSIKRSLILVFFGTLIVLIGFSRIYLGEHWASDVLGAYLLSSLTLVATIQTYIWGKTRFFVRQPVAPAEPKKS